jgi:predicted ABC-type sugar transport system permease subunit
MARTGVNNKKNNTKLNRAEGMMLIIVILHMNYTAINNSFFTNPNKKNTAIGEKSIPIFCIGNISLIGFKMGSVTWYRS